MIRRAMSLRSGAVLVALVGAGAACSHTPSDASQPLRRGQALERWITLPVRLSEARERHTATLLPDGSVLFAGGVQGHHVLSTAELYLPTTGEVRAVGPMAVARVGHAATVLRDGTVLFTGGEGDEAALAEVFTPDQGTFEPIGRLVEPIRAAHTASLLRDPMLGATGAVLLAGGCSTRLPNPWSVCSAPLSTLELYDPTTRTFGGGLPPLSRPRAQHRATVLGSGDVLFTGGSGFDASADRFVVGRGVIEPVSAPASHMAHTATLLHQGKVLLTGDWHEKDGTVAQLWDPTTALFEPVGALGTTRAWHTATLIATDRVLLTGGLTDREEPYPPKADVEEYDPIASAFVARPPLREARSFHTATHLPSGGVLVAGGRDAVEGQHSSLEVLPPPVGAFEEIPGDPFAGTDAASVLLSDGRVLVTGGSRPLPSASASLLDPRTGDGVATVGDMAVARFGHAMTLLDDGRVLVVGGTSSDAFAEIFDPTVGRFEVVAVIPAMPRPTATRLPSGDVLVIGGARALRYRQTLRRFEVVAADAPRREGHTATLLPDGSVLVAGGTPEPSSALVYRPEHDDFVPLNTPEDSGPKPRTLHTATLLPNGKVLLRGGRDDSASRPDADLFDPATRRFESIVDLTRRSRHTSTLLPTGEVLVVGGDASGTAELFDPATGIVRPTAPTRSAREGHAATLLLDGSVVVVGAKSVAPVERWRANPSAPERYRAKAAWSAATPSLVPGTMVELTGELFTCFTEANGGSPTSSATNHPVAIWMPREGTPSMGGIMNFGSGEVTWKVPASAFPGPGSLFVVVNGLAASGLHSVLLPAPNGHGCEVGAQCASGHCVDDVCCDTACEGSCKACSGAGTCVNTASGVADPRGVCQASACGTSLCDGSGRCETLPDGTSCSSSTMTAYCQAGACTSGPCASSRDCGPGEVCAADGLCRTPIAPRSEASCSTVRRGAPSAAWWCVLLLGLAPFGRQRARAALTLGWNRNGEA